MTATFHTLIDGATLNLHRDHPDWVIVDCRFTLSDSMAGEKAFALSRLPGARYAHLDRDLAGVAEAYSGRHPLPDPASFGRTLRRFGIRPESQVVVYDDSFGSIAARLWWLLRWSGHPAVALLDGGWQAWRRSGLPVEQGTPIPFAGTAMDYPVEPQYEMVAVTALVERVRAAPDWRLIDARPEDRYLGEREPIDPVAGHIPGSIWHTFEDNLELDGRYLDAKTLRNEFLSALGDVPATRTVHSCGSGVTACHNVLAMEHAGLSGSMLYVGSWSQWISDPLHPVATGAD